MENYSWPGNVRELRNIVERLAILATASGSSASLPAEIRQAAAAAGGLPSATWDEFKRLKQQVARRRRADWSGDSCRGPGRCDGNVSRAAEEIGIQRTNLHAHAVKTRLGPSKRRAGVGGTQPFWRARL